MPGAARVTGPPGPTRWAGDEAGHPERLVAGFHLVHIGVRPRTPARVFLRRR